MYGKESCELSEPSEQPPSIAAVAQMPSTKPVKTEILIYASHVSSNAIRRGLISTSIAAYHRAGAASPESESDSTFSNCIACTGCIKDKFAKTE
jgi:hypothetical protein